ncbi:MAG: GH1 family beta-glucosidase [Sphingobacteriaceae bacterium]
MNHSDSNILLKKESFGKDFQWGVSVAAYQIEGASDKDGKGKSIWDIFTTKKGKIHNGQNGDVACDFYNAYADDLALVKQLNIPNFRFSISWSRIMPSGRNALNEDGIKYYNRVIDRCLELGIEPWITVYHWDLPHALELLGGWTSRSIVAWFEDYVAVCAQHFGDRVKHWMVMNEPMVFTGAGYFMGIHAPGKTGMKNFLPAVHHATLSMVAGARKLRELLPAAIIGSTFSCSAIEPHSSSKKDLRAAKRVDALLNRLFIEPVLGLGYPLKDIPALKGIKKYILPGDEDLMTFDFDFIGLQNYTREIVKHSYFIPYIWAKLISPENRNVATTVMKWEIYPPAIYDILKKFSAYPGIKKILITENGAAFPDEVSGGKVCDPQREAYLKTHIAQVLKAKNEGCPVAGYFVWTLTDNFEWAEGYHPRFGLIHVDFETQHRIVKDSGIWYGDFLKAAIV